MPANMPTIMDTTGENLVVGAAIEFWSKWDARVVAGVRIRCAVFKVEILFMIVITGAPAIELDWPRRIRHACRGRNWYLVWVVRGKRFVLFQGYCGQNDCT